MLSVTRLIVPSCLALAVSGCGDNSSRPPLSPDAAEAPVDSPTSSQPAAPGIAYFDYALATAVSADGKTALFEELVSTGETAEARVWLYDTVTDVHTFATTLGDPTLALASAVSNGRTIAAQYSSPVVAALWSNESDWVPIPSPYSSGCDVHRGGAFDINADGTVVTGLLWNGCNPTAFRWTEDSGATLLDVLGTPAEGLPSSNRGSVVSRDGRVIAGFASHGNLDRVAAMWREDGSGELLDPNPFDAPSEVLSINADGTVLAGIFGFDGFIWTRGTGMAPIRRFDAALPTDAVFPNGMTDDGGMVVGGVGGGGPFSSPPIAFIWSQRDGMRSLIDLARAAGIAIDDTVVLTNANGVSGDGTVIVGTAVVGDAFKTFVLRLPEAAVAH